jgi:hypothetical protein
VPPRPRILACYLTTSVLSILFAGGVHAACAPPPGFHDRPPPAAGKDPVSHTEILVIRRTLPRVLQTLEGLSLADTIDPTSSLPHVTGTYPLTADGFQAAGARRLVCLSDGSTLVEQIRETSVTPERAVFRYVVWNYTSAQARAVEFAEGHFVREQQRDGTTRVMWTYSFHLRPGVFPGNMGAAGRFGFRKLFLERSYATMMRNTLMLEKRRAEQN